MRTDSTTISKREAAQADQYFTRPKIAYACIHRLGDALGEEWMADSWWVEPSAGNGSFLRQLPRWRAWGGDIHPQHPDVQLHDYLNDPLPPIPEGANGLAVGNPPFGKKSKLAIAFINRALEHTGIVGFIVPIHLRKWSAQRQIRKDARLIADLNLPEDAFLFLGEPYSLRCCFQIWTTLPEEQVPGENLRIAAAPPTSHPDFSAWQYNRTPDALKYFDVDWDIAVLRQGYGDFGRIYRKDEKHLLDRKKQWIFIKAHSPEALERLLSLDFTELSRKNTGTPGFGKADLVDAYANKDESA